MKFKLEIEMDNAAFEDEPCTELSHILNGLAYKIYAEDMILQKSSSEDVQDINGNTVGNWSLIESEVAS